MQKELNAADTVQRAVDRIVRRGRFADFTLSNGIVLKVKPVAPYLMTAVVKEFEYPDPPKVYMEEKGRDEENPNDPEYTKTVAEIDAARDLAVNDLLMGVGTEVSSVPEGYFPPESDNWIDQVEFAFRITGKELNIERSDTIRRYLCWLRFYALETQIDLALASGLPLQVAGIQEGEVEEVIESFRGVSERGADQQGLSTDGSENGDPENRAARRRRTRN